MLQFSCRFALLSVYHYSSFKPDTENDANFDAVSSTNAPTLTRCNFLNHIPKLIIFDTHNLQPFKHNTLINELLLMVLLI